MLAHFFRYGPAWKHRWRFSGHQACGDPFDGHRVERVPGSRGTQPKKPRPFDAIVDIGRDFILTSDKEAKLYITGPGPHQFSEHSPEAVIVSARIGLYGFKFVKAPESLLE